MTDKKETDLEKLTRLRGISRDAVHSIDRNLRAVYPNKTEAELEQMTITTIKNNLESCYE